MIIVAHANFLGVARNNCDLILAGEENLIDDLGYGCRWCCRDLAGANRSKMLVGGETGSDIP